MKNIPLDKVAKVIGEDSVRLLLEAFPGDNIYLRRNIESVQDRNKAILNDFYTMPLLTRQGLAEKYKLSESAINKILNSAAKHKI